MEEQGFFVDIDKELRTVEEIEKDINIDHLKILNDIRKAIRTNNTNEIFELWNGKTVQVVNRNGKYLCHCNLASITTQKPCSFYKNKVIHEMYAIIEILKKMGINVSYLNFPNWLFRGYNKDYPKRIQLNKVLSYLISFLNTWFDYQCKENNIPIIKHEKFRRIISSSNNVLNGNIFVRTVYIKLDNMNQYEKLANFDFAEKISCLFADLSKNIPVYNGHRWIKFQIPITIRECSLLRFNPTMNQYVYLDSIY